MKIILRACICYILAAALLYSICYVSLAESRLYIDAVGVDVGIYVKNYYGTDSQYYVDKKDCALAQVTYDKTLHICDHNNQGFANLKYVEVGDVAYTIINGEYTYYVCVDVGYGTSNDYGKCYNGYNIWKGAYKKDGHEYALVCTTCTEKAGRILVTVWDLDEDEEAE